jgi:protein-tyrosine phosphatase
MKPAQPSGVRSDTGVLFVCMGNICRSPLAEGVFRKLQREQAPQLAMRIDSAGTHAYHVGEPPDLRALAVARAHGFDIGAHCGRVVTRVDFNAFDYILAMDRTNLARLRQSQPQGSQARVHL